MKRSIPSDFDPVYPYGDKRPFNIMPPFYSQDGFQEAPTATLSLKIDNPLTFNSDGDLTVKVGGGVTINQNGQLETTNATTAVNPPLEYANGAISLNTGEGLTLDSTQRLTTLAAAPLISTSAGIGLNAGDGLEVKDDKLKVKGGQGIAVGVDGVEVTAASYFSFPNNTLSLILNPPFTLDSGGQLALTLGNGLQLTNDQLSVKTSPVFTFSDGAMSLNAGNGIQIENQAVAVYAASYFQYTDRALALRLANGLTTSNNNLVINYGKGLFINTGESGRLQVNIRSPLNYYGSSNSIGLETGNGLGVTSLGALGGNLYVALGAGLSFDAVGNVQVNIGDGLELSTNIIGVKLGNGLTFSGGAITLAGDSPAYTDYTLWTTPDPSPNASISEELDAKLVLSLSKAGSTAIGTVGIVGVKGALLSIGEQAINAEVYFDTNGNISFATSTLKSYWGFRTGDSYDPNSTLNPLYLMPNQAAYPPGRSTITQISSLEVYLGGDTSKPVALEVAFNTLEYFGYSLKFTWRNLGSYTGQTFAVSLGTFTYITQQ